MPRVSKITAHSDFAHELVFKADSVIFTLLCRLGRYYEYPTKSRPPKEIFAEKRYFY